MDCSGRGNKDGTDFGYLRGFKKQVYEEPDFDAEWKADVQATVQWSCRYMGTKQMGSSKYGKERTARCHDERPIGLHDGGRKKEKISPFMQLASMLRADDAGS